MTRALVALGSNLGERRSHLAWAVARLRGLARTRLEAATPPLATPPLGGPPQGDYLNAVARLDTELSPMGLLIELKRLEAERGRRPGPRWGPRTLDLDILRYGRARLRGPFLTLPHPRLGGRAFLRRLVQMIESPR
ncbi:MAG TPA: 2-amino-4-hydroxy-6-hydroxymethyldihydropteridine diphosphokinase [Elusimicrobiota bacterium]|jgi:2-amino-4-hydroxy-6-hydroxymethyldihydropteridine diphosphokinase|nr:2-amino-4-hydroxy-6-hydroxymethyldihydropteridine diphosphokinase [Elusimicrobiota bacterium]